MLGAKLVFLFGEYGWPFRPVDDWREILYSGRSIVGALIFGLLGCRAGQTAGALIRFPERPLCRTLAVLVRGRRSHAAPISGCCRGTPTNSSLAIVYSDGIPRHPVQIYEILFHILAGCVGIVLVKRKLFRGSVFSLYLIAYGAFRPGDGNVIRETPQSFLVS